MTDTRGNNTPLVNNYNVGLISSLRGIHGYEEMLESTSL